MDCSICLDKINCLDFIRLLDCGHQFHNICFLRGETGRCPMCRHLTEDTISYCISNENFNFFELGSEMFEEQVNCLKKGRDIIKKKECVDLIQLSKEKMQKYQDVIDRFFKENLNGFKFKILKAIKDEKHCVDIYESMYGESFEECPIISLLKGRHGNRSWFRDQTMTSVSDKLYEFFNLTNVFIISDDGYRKNYIRVYL